MPCLYDPRMPGEAHHPESAERVEWTETRNLATSEGERAGRIMAATAEASPELKRLAGVAATGRKLARGVCARATATLVPAPRLTASPT